MHSWPTRTLMGKMYQAHPRGVYWPMFASWCCRCTGVPSGKFPRDASAWCVVLVTARTNRRAAATALSWGTSDWCVWTRPTCNWKTTGCGGGGGRVDLHVLLCARPHVHVLICINVCMCTHSYAYVHVQFLVAWLHLNRASALELGLWALVRRGLVTNEDASE